MSAFKVGNVWVESPLVLAPMEDVSNMPFRLIAKRLGNPGLMFTEFVSAMAIHYKAKKTYKKLRIHPNERPLGIQIFGSDLDSMVETALICEESGADLVDINMGCWVPKVCKTGAGAAMLKDPVLAEQIVAAVVKALKVPVTVKVRAGWDQSNFSAPDLVRRFEDVGAKMITLHARFAKQGFEGEADWNLICRLREVLTIPLVGNGDVKTPDDALAMLNRTGCDGVMVGRAAISNPWALQRIDCALKGTEIPAEPTLEDRIATAMEHLRLMIQYEAAVTTWDDILALDEPVRKTFELVATRHLRGQLAMYIKGTPGAPECRNALVQCSSYQEVSDVFERFFAEPTIRR